MLHAFRHLDQISQNVGGGGFLASDVDTAGSDEEVQTRKNVATALNLQKSSNEANNKQKKKKTNLLIQLNNGFALTVELPKVLFKLTQFIHDLFKVLEEGIVNAEREERRWGKRQ